MKLIVALGNPGPQYAATRHNAGFMLIDAYAAANGLTFNAKPKFNALVAESTSGDEKVLYIKPTTFYNESGVAARAISDFYKIAPHDTLIIHDDLMLPLGTLRTRVGGRDAGNNGVKSVNAHLGQGTARLRVGTWTEHRDTVNDVDFVLSAFSSDEQKILRELQPKIFTVIDSFVDGTLEQTTHR